MRESDGIEEQTRARTFVYFCFSRLSRIFCVPLHTVANSGYEDRIEINSDALARSVGFVETEEKHAQREAPVTAPVDSSASPRDSLAGKINGLHTHTWS